MKNLHSLKTIHSFFTKKVFQAWNWPFVRNSRLMHEFLFQRTPTSSNFCFDKITSNSSKKLASSKMQYKCMAACIWLVQFYRLFVYFSQQMIKVGKKKLVHFSKELITWKVITVEKYIPSMTHIANCAVWFDFDEFIFCV